MAYYEKADSVAPGIYPPGFHSSFFRPAKFTINTTFIVIQFKPYRICKTKL